MLLAACSPGAELETLIPRQGEIREFFQEPARTRLARAEHDLALAEILSPIDGVVLERFEQGGGPLPGGRPLLRPILRCGRVIRSIKPRKSSWTPLRVRAGRCLAR